MSKTQSTIVMTLSLLILAVASAHGQEDCCQVFKLKDCPPVAPCRLDACVTIQITPIDKQDANFTYSGTNSFMNIFGAAVARGAENATIRAMNAIKVCPNCTQSHEGTCDPAKAAEAAPQPPAPQPPAPSGT